MGDAFQHKWFDRSWEEMAREHPFAAVMTTSEMIAADPDSPELLKDFFDKGRRLVKSLEPVLPQDRSGLIVDYGCGAGRMLKPLVEDGYRCAGLDIAPTMIGHARRLVPGAELHALQDGRSPLPDGCAALVYSYAVVQHISRLSAYVQAFDEMCRLLAPGGRLMAQVVCQDMLAEDGSRTGRTENHEDHSWHFPDGQDAYRHDQNNWSGVHIGREAQEQMLADRGVRADQWRPYKTAKRYLQWVIGTRV